MSGRSASIVSGTLLAAVGAAVRCGPAVAVVPGRVLVSVSVPGGVLRSHGTGANLTLVRADGERDPVALSVDGAPDAVPGSWIASLAVRNFGDRETVSPVEIAIFVDGALVRSWVIAGSIAPGETVRNERIPIGTLAEGRHEARVVIDPMNRVEESMKTDNEFRRTFTAPPGP